MLSQKGFWFKIAARPRFQAKPDDASISNFKGAPFEIASNNLLEVITINGL